MRKKCNKILALLLVLIIFTSSMPIQTKAAAKKTVVTKVTLNKSQYVLKKGEKLGLKATISPAKAKSSTKLKWTSSNKKIATVTSKGVVTAKAKKGKVKITVTAGKKKASCNITIGTSVKKIVASNLKLTVGKSAKIKAIVSPKKASVKKLTYKSNNPQIATVDSKGNVKSRKSGTAKITITAADRNKIKKTIKVTVTKQTSDVTKNPEINVAGYSTTGSNNVTEENVTVTGTAVAYSATIKKVSYSLKYAKDDKAAVNGTANGTANGTTNWKIEKLPLQIGANILTITAVDSKDRTATQNITFNRLSTGIEINVNGFSDVESNNVEEEKITVAGTAFSSATTIAKVSYALKYAMDEQASVTGTASGTTNWKIEKLPLQIGTNVLTITVVDSKKRIVEKEIVFNRLSTEIKLSENVVLFEEEQNTAISNDILDYWMDDQETEDTSDDLVNILFHENAELVQSIRNNHIKIGDIVMLQPCEALYMGFNGVLISYGDPTDSNNYPANDYELICFRAADFTDIFDGDVSLSYEISDADNPVAFAYFPTDVEIASLDSYGYKERILYASEGYGDQSQKQEIKEAGFQKSAIPYMMNDALNINGGISSSNGLNLGITFKDAVFYDKDGNSGTTNDQFKIGGKIAYENLTVDAGIEWHVDPLHMDLLPQQIVGKYAYNTNIDMHAKWTGSTDLSDLVKNANKALNNEFENNKQFLGMTLSGIDMKDSIILGMFGIQISPVGINPTVGVKNTQYSSVFNKLSAIIVIIPVLDVTGKITAKVGFTYTYSAYHENGINMQKKGFVGSHGSLEENKGQTSIELPFDRSLEIYDVCARSSSEKDIDPGWSVIFGGEGDALEEVAFGADIGLMISGIVPTAVKGRIYEKAEVKASGEIKLGNGLEVLEGSDNTEQKNKVSVKVDGNIGANLYMGLKAGAYFKLAAKTDLFSPELVGKKEWNHDFCQMTIASIAGRVVKEDNDADNANNEALEGVKVCLEKEPVDNGMGGRKSEPPIEAYTNEEGKFLFPNVKDGEYRLTFSKDGYETYEKVFSMKGENQEFYIGMKQKDDLKSKLSELISTYGVFNANQNGTMHKWDDEWLDPSGIISATVLDFDSDGEDEMLVCCMEPSSSNKGSYQIVMKMYEVINGIVVLADSLLFNAYHEFQDSGVLLSPALWAEHLFNMHIVRLNGSCYLMCENESIWGTFADGFSQDYWIMAYQNNKLQYVGSFTQTGGGSSGFEYTGYEFENGKLVDSILYYNEEYPYYGGTPLYDDFATGVAEFLKKFGISVTTDIRMYRDVELGTILSEKNDKSEIFRFTNKNVSNDYSSSTYKFVATLNRAEVLESQ